MSTRTVTVVPLPGHGAEDVAVDADGAAYTGTEDGAVWRVTAGGARVERVADTGGRPLGIELLPDGRLLVCDAHRGVLRVDPGTGAVEPVVAEVAGVPMRFCNNAAVAPDGTVWFSDSSARFGIEDYQGDVGMVTRTGRLLRLDPDGSVGVALDGLDFANGVALAADGSYVVVAESGACTLVRLWLTGEQSGTHDLLVPELAGYPDNIALGSDGLLWVAYFGPRVRMATLVRGAPRWVRRAATSVPHSLQPAPARWLRVQAFDSAGGLVHDLDLPAHDFANATGVREHDGRLWLASLAEPAIAYVDL